MSGPPAAAYALPMTQVPEGARRLLAALTRQDFDQIETLMSAAIRFRSLVPSGSTEVNGAGEAVARLRHWFSDVDVLDVLDTRIAPVCDRVGVGYRFRVHKPDGWKEVDQQIYLDFDGDGRIAAMDLLCSGFRPTAGADAPSGSTHRFDAGTMGCADGLAQEFRRRIQGIPVGDELVVETTDPAAKQDLPPLARMMGHTVRSIESPAGGRLLITVERGR
jgi:TusA-related sulfurtransferase